MAVIGTVTQVFAVSMDLMLVHQLSYLTDKGLIQRRWSTDGQRQSVAHERKALGEMTECFSSLATNVDPVLRCDLHKTDGIANNFGGVSLKRTQKGPPQTKSRTR